MIEDYDLAKSEAMDLAGLKADEIIGFFDYERIKRSRFQYGMTDEVKTNKAKTSLERAKKFVFELEKIIE